jgi:hypothetical protein
MGRADAGTGPTRRTAGLALIGIVALVAVIAPASWGLRTRSASTTIAPDEKGAATAKCKRGSEAVSGGFENPGWDLLSMTDTAIWTYGSRRDGRRKVAALGVQDGTVSGNLIAFAYCDKDQPGLKRTSASTAVAFLDDESITAKCKRGSEAVWGGFNDTAVQSADFPILPLGSSREGKRKWTASGVKFDDPSTLTVVAYCDKSEPGLKTRSRSTTIGHDQTGSATAKCRRGSKAVSGGFFAPGGFDLNTGSEIYFYESHRVGKRKWTASGLNQGDPAKLTAYAYCEKT